MLERIVMGLLNDDFHEQLQKYQQLMSVMGRPAQEPWKPDHERVGGHALEAPMVSPDDLIGTGIPTKIAGLLGMAAKGAASMPAIGLLGHTAWHGSPHKFDKFALEKIGTGEGAQAYGHGLYLAENPQVAKEYQLALGNKPSAADDFAGFEAQAAIAKNGGSAKKAISWLESRKKVTDEAKQFLMPGAHEKQMADFDEAIRRIQSGEVSKNAGQLYKTDIPDEALPRMLDWDKPLSQQSQEVQGALANAKNKQLRSMMEYAKVPYSEAIGGEEKTMGEAFRLLNLNLQGKSSADSAKASALLARQGIPGIRYLDGGSRGAGAGSSNFVMFDPDMIRILERNGQPTGQKPWQPGEWKP